MTLMSREHLIDERCIDQRVQDLQRRRDAIDAEIARSLEGDLSLLGDTVPAALFDLAWEPPALLARRFSTLDHLTDGRIGWNIVTGYLDSAARAMGLDCQMAHDDRYDMADEFMAVVYRLWEESWAADAVKVSELPTAMKFFMRVSR